MFSTEQTWFNESETVLNYERVPTPIHSKVYWEKVCPEIKIKKSCDGHQLLTIWFFPIVFLSFIISCIIYFVFY